MSYFPIVFGLVGVYVIFTGLRALFTGRLSAPEEKKMVNFTPKAAKTYKLTYAVINTLIGLICIGLAVVKILIRQEIIQGDDLVYTLIFLGAVLVLGVIQLIVWMKCKKDTE